LIAPQQEGEMPPGSGLGGQKALKESSEMTETLLQRVWTWLHETFPERQIYIRSDGRVQFFTFGPSLQATLAGLTLIFLGWVAFATVNVIFKDRIIAATDHRYQQMQSAYENRVADLQLSYDELNGALVAAEDRFKATADGLAAKQNAISGFLAKQNEANAAVGGIRSNAQRQPLVYGNNAPLDTTSSEGAPPPEAEITAEDAGSSALPMMSEMPAPQPRTGQAPAPQQGFISRALDRMRSFFGGASTPQPRRVSAAYAGHPALKALAEQTARIAALDSSDTMLMARTETTLRQGVSNLRAVIRASGLHPDQFPRRVAASAVGGPDIPLDNVRLEGISDPEFTQAYLRASTVLAELEDLITAVSHVPLAMPVSDAQFDRSSGFGVRMDPFTGRYAFHPGVDFAGPYGAKVAVTASGIVTSAGYRGAYGNMVEVDHGFGLRTRYGHLSRITVRPGMRLPKGAEVGRVGSTGRSTGSHVHYEVLYDNKVRNPNSFIEAGRNVL
jgi:murein DD-endopeptidase MepM/ murein hydrolase activator NlpD